MLNELEMTGREVEGAKDIVDTIGRIRQVTESQEAALDAVAKAMLESGLLGDDRIAKAEQASAEKYVQDRTAELQAKAEETLSAKRDELRRVDAELKDIQAKLQKVEAQRRTKLDNELAAEREMARQEMDAEREELQKQKAELQRQQNLLQDNLQKVTKDLREAGDEVVNRFLTIAPLLGSLGLVNGQATRLERSATAGADEPDKPATYKIPSFVTGTATSADEELNEETFFDRFRRVVESSGFIYRPLDLQRFHLSVKCGELTVLGGPSGTGKSSLPALMRKHCWVKKEATVDRVA